MAPKTKCSIQAAPELKAFYSWLRKALLAFTLGIALFIYGFFGPTDVKPGWGWSQLSWSLVGIITLFVMWYSGGHFFSGTWKAIKAHKANMYTLIALATGPAWLYSFVVSIWPNIFPLTAREVHYDVPLTVIGLIVFGAAFEMRASAKSSMKVRKLESLRRKKAHIIREEQPIEVQSSHLNVGDIIQVHINEIIPVDGEVIEGTSEVDESAYSAKRKAVSKTIGDLVFSGSMNKSKTLLIKATQLEKESALEKVIHILMQAQNSRPSIGNISNKVAAFFAPFVLILAILTPLMWYNFGPSPQISYMLITFMAVLLIACPCALGLATQISITAGVSKAADFGILFRKGDAVQDSNKLTTLLLEQSGIVTEEEPTLVEIDRLTEISEEELLQYAGSICQTSEEAIAHKIALEAKHRKLSLYPIEKMHSASFHGVTAKLNKLQIIFGDKELLAQHGVTPPTLTDYEGEDKERIHYYYLVIDGKCVARFSFLFRLQNDARDAIAKLKKRGLKIVLLSHRKIELARAVASQLGIEEVFADINSKDKTEIVQRYQQHAEKVGYVSNGADDEPLKQANVGFAVGKRAYLSKDADVIMLDNSLYGLVDVVRVSKSIMTNIKENLTAAFVYNVVGLPIAAGILYPWLHTLMSPILAGALMASSSFGVVINANRLLLIKPSKRAS